MQRRLETIRKLHAACQACCSQRARALYCCDLGREVGPLIVESRPFCPQGKHEHITAAAKVSLIRRAENGSGPLGPPLTSTSSAVRGRINNWLRRVVGGAIQLFVVLVGRCRTPAEAVQKRQSQCRGDAAGLPCPALKRFFFIRVCRDCGCILWGKTRLATASCPRGQWGPVAAERCGAIRVLRCLGWQEGGCCGGR